MRIAHYSIATAILAVAISVIPGAASTLDHEHGGALLVQAGTLLTAHLTHWNLPHLILDTAALLVLGSIVESRSPILWLRSIGLTLILVPPVLIFAAPGITAYRGLSGLDAALFAAAACHIGSQARQQGNRPIRLLAFAAGSIFMAKTVWEWQTQSPLFARGGSIGFQVLPQVHLAGAVAGLTAALLTDRQRTRRAGHPESAGFSLIGSSSVRYSQQPSANEPSPQNFREPPSGSLVHRGLSFESPTNGYSQESDQGLRTDPGR